MCFNRWSILPLAIIVYQYDLGLALNHEWGLLTREKINLGVRRDLAARRLFFSWIRE